jgi:thiosulfate reductase cytochrome b subunit
VTNLYPATPAFAPRAAPSLARRAPRPHDVKMPDAQPRRPQPWPIRVTHWLNVPALIIMAGSGLQILIAYPRFGPRGALYRWYPLQNWRPPTWLTLGDWLAGARALHFAFAWLLVVNGLAYLAYVLASGEWRRRFAYRWRDTRGAAQMALYYLRLRREPPESGLYNPLQRVAYTAALALAVVEVASGLAIYKPVQLPWLVAAFGGYDFARVVHFGGLVALAAFVVGHVILVALHPRAAVEIVTGGQPR